MKVAVIGASGAVGREMVKELEKVKNCDFELSLFASKKSEGRELTFRGTSLKVMPFDLKGLSGVKFVLMSAGGTFSRENAKAIAGLGCTVIDNSSAWRMDPDVPLVVPEVNRGTLKNFKGGAIIANPNCSTIQLVVCLKPFTDRSMGLKKVVVTSFQSVSGSGQKGINELDSQVKAIFVNGSQPKPDYYPRRIAFNVIPAIDTINPLGHAFEEEKVIKESRKILGLPSLQVLATTARVPTFNCHCESVLVELERQVSRQDVFKLLSKAEGLVCRLEDSYENFPLPSDVKDDGRVWISRVRLPFGEESSNWVQFWNVADNLKKGAATNAVQIMEMLL